MTLILDSGGVGLLAASRADTARMGIRFGRPFVVPAVVLAESLTGDHRRDHSVNRLLAVCLVVPVDEQHGREAARLRTRTGRAGTVSAADALVAAVAAGYPQPTILTSDPGDIAALAAEAGLPITIVPV